MISYSGVFGGMQSVGPYFIQDFAEKCIKKRNFECVTNTIHINEKQMKIVYDMNDLVRGSVYVNPAFGFFIFHKSNKPMYDDAILYNIHSGE